MKRNPKIHKDLIIAWANGAQIQKMGVMNQWIDCDPEWYAQSQYRIKPINNPDKQIMFCLEANSVTGLKFRDSSRETFIDGAQYIYVTFHGETNNIKKVEIAK
jgi:hypothetical protein